MSSILAEVGPGVFTPAGGSPLSTVLSATDGPTAAASGFVRWLLDLDVIPSTAEQIHLGWERGLPSWIWLLTLAAAIAVAFWSYRGLVGFRRGRIALAAIRGVLLILLVVLIAGPKIVAPKDLVERDWVVVLVDRSQSLTIVDEPMPVPVPTEGAEPVESQTLSADDGGFVDRETALRAAVEAAGPAFARLAAQHQVQWLGFHDGVFELSDPGATDTTVPDAEASTPRQRETANAGPELGDAIGARTLIGESLDQALRRLAARPVSAVVVLSDGQSSDRLSRTVQRRLEADRIPVFTFALGSPGAAGDLAIRRIAAPRRAFIDDRVPVDIDLDVLGQLAATDDTSGGASSGQSATPIVVRIADRETGRTLAEETWLVGPTGRVLGEAGRVDPDAVVADSAAADTDPSLRRLTVNVVPDRRSTGVREWSVTLETPGRRDLVDSNNTQIMPIELVDRPLRVLYFDGYPRWEFRYLKNVLIRETSIDASSILFSADRDFAQEGNTPISRMPRTADEYEPFDVIIIGDVAPGLLSDTQWELIRRQVADRGAGLLFMAGPRANPRAYALPTIASLLPFQQGVTLPSFAQPVTMAPSLLARSLGVLRLDYYDQNAWEILSDPVFGWNRLQWALRIEPEDLKPAAESLALARPVVDAPNRESRSTEQPLIVRMRYGAGQTLFVATDEIWRWRYGEGELLPEQFWIQLIRMLGRERLDAGGDGAAALVVRPRRTEVGQSVVVDLRLLDQAMLESLAFPDGIAIELVRRAPIAPENDADAVSSDGAAGVETVELERVALTLQPDGAVGTAERGSRTPDRFSTTFLSDQAGSWVARVTEPALAELQLSDAFEVLEPDLELRRPAPDHQLLADLAESTGGQALRIADLPQIDRLPFPNRSIETPLEIEEPIWDTPLALALVLLLLSLEWVGRKLLRLV